MQISYNEWIVSNYAYFVWLVKRVKMNKLYGSIEDAVQEAIAFVLTAMPKYDPSRGSLATFVRMVVIGEASKLRYNHKHYKKHGAAFMQVDFIAPHYYHIQHLDAEDAANYVLNSITQDRLMQQIIVAKYVVQKSWEEVYAKVPGARQRYRSIDSIKNTTRTLLREYRQK